MTVVPTHGGTAPDAFDVAHRGQIVSFPPGPLAVDPWMRATIEASDADVEWDDCAVGDDAAPDDVVTPRRRGRPPKQA